MTWVFFAFLLGGITGSVLVKIAWRLFSTSPVWSASHCPACHKRVPWGDKIPALSYWLLDGKCRFCQEDIDKAYPAAEIITASLFAIIAGAQTTMGAPVGLAVLCMIAVAVLLLTAVSDYKYKLIFDIVLLPAAILLAPLIILYGVGLWQLLFGALIAGALYGVLTVASQGALAAGDTKLAIVVGMLLGWWVIVATLAAFLAIALHALITKLRKHPFKQEIPYGAYFAPVSALLLLYISFF